MVILPHEVPYTSAVLGRRHDQPTDEGKPDHPIQNGKGREPFELWYQF